MAVLLSPREGAHAFLAANGLSEARVSALAVDASFRRYFSVVHGGERCVLMDAPPEHEDVAPFVTVAEYLARWGLRAPRIFARDVSQGFLLLEDFGTQRMRDVLDTAPEREAAVYEHAVDLLGRLRAVPSAPVAAYDEEVLLREAELLPQWFLPAVGIEVDIDDYLALWRRCLADVSRSRIVTVLRDYHAENIMLLDDEALGLLDFQDALVGHPAYDLVSLLQDARRDVPVELERAMLDRYLAAHGEDAAFEAAYAVLGAQRNAKIIGIFARLARRDGKPRYLSYLPRVWTYLERDLAHPALSELKHWFDTQVPEPVRRALTA